MSLEYRKVAWMSQCPKCGEEVCDLIEHYETRCVKYGTEEE
jgi:hypothetical protein